MRMAIGSDDCRIGWISDTDGESDRMDFGYGVIVESDGFRIPIV